MKDDKNFIIDAIVDARTKNEINEYCDEYNITINDLITFAVKDKVRQDYDPYHQEEYKKLSELYDKKHRENVRHKNELINIDKQMTNVRQAIMEENRLHGQKSWEKHWKELHHRKEYKYRITLYENYNNYDDMKFSLPISDEQANILEENFSKLNVEQVTHEPVTDYLCELLEGVRETVNVTVDEFKKEETDDE